MKHIKPATKFRNKTFLLILTYVGTHLLYSCSGPTVNSAPDIETSQTEIDSLRDPLFFIPGQLCQHLRKIFQDSKGNLWLGTNVYDLMLYNGDSLRYIDERDGFQGGRVTGICEDSLGNIWVSSAAGLNKYDGQKFTVYAKAQGLKDEEIWCMLQDSKGTIWVGHGSGISKFDGEKFENFNVPKAPVQNAEFVFSPDRIVAMAEDSSGNLWLGTDGYGVCKFDGKSFIHFTSKEGLPDNAISEILIDTKGRIWMGTYWGGLSMYDGNKFKNYTQDGELKGVEISAFYEDKNGDIWIGVENNGVYIFNGQTFRHIEHAAFHGASILSIYRESSGDILFGGWGGLLRMHNEEIVPVSKRGPWR